MKRITKLGIGLAAVIGTVIWLQECKWFRTYEIPKNECQIVYNCGRICYQGLEEDKEWFKASVEGESTSYGVEEQQMAARGGWLKIVSADEEKLVLER